jgi:hypothetical protein
MNSLARSAAINNRPSRWLPSFFSRVIRRTPGYTFLLFLLLVFTNSNLLGAVSNLSSVSLAWDSSPDPTVVGYRVHFGVASNTLSTSVDVGNTTTTTIPNLYPGLLYYFTVTSYNSANLDSIDSNKISHLVPGGISSVQLTRRANKQVVISGVGQIGKVYTIQASQDLRSWITLGLATAGLNGIYSYTDFNAPNIVSRFYRVTAPFP